MSGPGWFNDIFEAQFSFEESSYTTIPDRFEKLRKDNATKTIKCFDGKSTITGKLVVRAPEGRVVSHNGIDITFQSTAHAVALDSIGSDAVVKKTWTLLDAGSVDGTIEVGFDIDLPALQKVLRDTFDGQHMSLRHSLSFRIVRPWYTFSVRGEEAIAIANAALPEVTPPEPTETVLRVDDFGGVCDFDHGKCSFSADGQLLGTVSFSQMDQAQPIAKVELLVGRTEQWGPSEEQQVDVVVRTHCLHGTDLPPITSSVDMPVDIDLAAKGSELGGEDGALARSMMPLVPEDKGVDPAAVTAVTYWVRTVLTGVAPEDPKAGPPKFWSTHPVWVLAGKDAGSV